MNLRKPTAILFLILLITNSGCQKSVRAFKNTSIANEPTLKLNSMVLISESKIPQQNDFVSYSYKSEISGDEIRIHRMVAKENDILEIRDGVVYVNNKDIDRGKNLVHYYKILRSDYLEIKSKESINDQFPAYLMGNDSVNGLLEDAIAKNIILNLKKK